MLVRDVMHQEVFKTRESQSLRDVLSDMLQHGVRHAAVMRDHTLVGVLSERNILSHRARWGHNGKVSEAMSSAPYTTSPDASIESASALMSTHKVGCLPVVERGRLLGIITTTDLLAALAQDSVLKRPSSKAADIMQARVQVMHAEDRLLDAAHRMLRAGVRHLPVVDGDGALVGMLSDRDVRKAGGDPRQLLDRGRLREHFASTRVGQAMTRNPTSVSKEMTLEAVGHLMIEQHIGAVPVTEADGHVAGIISYVDILCEMLSPPVARLHGTQGERARGDHLR